jgi:hypothetical protein
MFHIKINFFPSWLACQFMVVGNKSVALVWHFVLHAVSPQELKLPSLCNLLLLCSSPAHGPEAIQAVIHLLEHTLPFPCGRHVTYTECTFLSWLSIASSRGSQTEHVLESPAPSLMCSVSGSSGAEGYSGTYIFNKTDVQVILM